MNTTQILSSHFFQYSFQSNILPILHDLTNLRPQMIVLSMDAHRLDRIFRVLRSTLSDLIE